MCRRKSHRGLTGKAIFQPRLGKGARVSKILVVILGEVPATGFPLSLSPSHRKLPLWRAVHPRDYMKWTEDSVLDFFFSSSFPGSTPSTCRSSFSAQTVTGGQPLLFLHATPKHFPDICSASIIPFHQRGGHAPGPVTAPEEEEEPRAEGSFPGPTAASTWSGISAPHLKHTQQNPSSQHLPFLQRQKRCSERHACNRNSENFIKHKQLPQNCNALTFPV